MPDPKREPSVEGMAEDLVNRLYEKQQDKNHSVSDLDVLTVDFLNQALTAQRQRVVEVCREVERDAVSGVVSSNNLSALRAAQRIRHAVEGMAPNDSTQPKGDPT